ncbi:MAG: DUF2125 domain-containing protein [Pseudomonadota bacterium]|nr:DUF2125 domain-containing protein [Pseudomonadota bacterium]
MRRLVITLGLVFVVLAAIWSAGWFALAAWADGQVSGVLARIRDRGIEVDCGARDMVGFPFALKLACGETAVAERGSGSQAQLAGLTGGASIFSPRTAQIALASPARVESPLLTAPADLRWNDADVDVAMNLNGPQAVSFDAEDFAAELPLPNLPASFAARSAAGTLSPATDGGADADLTFTQLALTAAGTTLPPFDGQVSAWLSVPPRALLSGRAGLQAPLSARLIDVSFTSGAARLDAEGEISVDEEGILDGMITLRIAGTEALPALIAELPPEQQKLANAAVGGLLTFGSRITLDGEPASELRVEIERGEAKVGPITVRVPRVPL